MWLEKLATKRPVPTHTDGPMSKHLGVILHVNDSDGNLYNWVSGNHNMSCHFEVYKDGSAEQYLDTEDSSWAQEAGNATYMSIETEGYPNEPLTDAQVKKCAEIVAALHKEYGFPLHLANTPGERGLGWHGMGGQAWGNHPGCPGDKRKAQRADILAQAGAILAPVSLLDWIGSMDGAPENLTYQQFLADIAHEILTTDDIPVGTNPTENPTATVRNALGAVLDTARATKASADAIPNHIDSIAGRIVHDGNHDMPEALVHIMDGINSLRGETDAKANTEAVAADTEAHPDANPDATPAPADAPQSDNH